MCMYMYSSRSSCNKHHVRQIKRLSSSDEVEDLRQVRRRVRAPIRSVARAHHAPLALRFGIVVFKAPTTPEASVTVPNTLYLRLFLQQRASALLSLASRPHHLVSLFRHLSPTALLYGRVSRALAARLARTSGNPVMQHDRGSSTSTASPNGVACGQEEQHEHTDSRQSGPGQQLRRLRKSNHGMPFQHGRERHEHGRWRDRWLRLRMRQRWRPTTATAAAAKGPGNKCKMGPGPRGGRDRERPRRGEATRGRLR